MKLTDGLITYEKDGITTIDHLLTYSEEEKQQHEIDNENAKLVFNWKYLVVPREVFQMGLSGNDAILYSFIHSFIGDNNRFYFTNEQLASIFNISESAVTKILAKFKEKRLIKLSYKRKADGGQIRFVELPTSKKYEYQLVKSTSSNSEKVRGNNNKINNNKINNTIDKSIVVKQYGNGDINSVSQYFLETMGIPSEDCTREQSRRYWKLLLKESKTGVDGVKWLVDVAAADQFFRHNITSSKDLYYKRVKLIARKRGNGVDIAVMTEKGGSYGREELENNNRSQSLLADRPRAGVLPKIDFAR